MNYIPPDQGPGDYSDVDGDGGNWSTAEPDLIDDDPHPDGPPQENPIYSRGR